MRPPTDAASAADSYRRIMTTATLPLPRMTARPERAPAARGASAAGAAVLSIFGSMAAFGIAALGLLVVPVAAAVVFGPAVIGLLF